MTKRSALEDEWELYKDVILGLYITQSKSLVEVITTMAKQGFNRTYIRASPLING
jgi:hypothetical protein